MGYLSLEDFYPDDVEKYGHLRVGITDLYVKDNLAIYGEVTRGECRELTSRLLCVTCSPVWMLIHFPAFLGMAALNRCWCRILGF